MRRFPPAELNAFFQAVDAELNSPATVRLIGGSALSFYAPAHTGLGDYLRRHGNWVVEEQLLRPGTQRRNWKNTLLSDGHLMVRHPDWDEAYRMSFAAASGSGFPFGPSGFT